MSEPSTDLAIVCAIASSYYEQPIARDVACIAEVRVAPGRRPCPPRPPAGLPARLLLPCRMAVCALPGRVRMYAISLPPLTHPRSPSTAAVLHRAPPPPQVGLGGELRPVGNMERRIAEAAKVCDRVGVGGRAGGWGGGGEQGRGVDLEACLPAELLSTWPT